MNDDDNERRLPPPLPEKFVHNKVRDGSWRQETPPRAPLRAIRIKGDALRAVIRNGNQLDWTDIHERYVDLWQEARLVIWRAKHSKAGILQTDPITARLWRPSRSMSGWCSWRSTPPAPSSIH